MATHPYGRRPEQSANGSSSSEVEPEADRSNLSISPEQSETESHVPSDLLSNNSGASSVINPTTVSSKTVRERELNRERVRRFRLKHKNRRTQESGRAKETNAGNSRKAATQTALDLNHILFSLHMMGAAMLKAPALLITEDEAQRLATAITHVTELYDGPIMDEKTRAWLNLGMVGVQVYGTRVTAV